MTLYSVYLEVSSQGLCMAHVLDLPGCFARATSREEALHKLYDAIQEYCAWLRSHLVVFFRLMAYSRSDLLSLVQNLREEALDWNPDPESFTIRKLLRHIGNVEEWYVSRLVPPETLPPEWEQDESLSIFEFLEMERRTVLARLRQMTEQELADVFYPARWTQNPEEPWTARKALRRFLEHEREHTAQGREILARYLEGKESGTIRL